MIDRLQADRTQYGVWDWARTGDLQKVATSGVKVKLNHRDSRRFIEGNYHNQEVSEHDVTESIGQWRGGC